MKRLLIILMAAIMLLVACGNDEPKEESIVKDEIEQEEKEENKVELIGKKEHNIILLDNDDLKITLLDSVHERIEDYEVRDVLFLDLEIENKKDRTFKFYIDNASIDGRSERYEIGQTETEVGPEEKITITANFSAEILTDDKTLSFEEHLSGRLTYSDYEGNREQVEFSTYINE